MNRMLNTVLTEIEKNFSWVNISFSNNIWRKDIPSQPGWYLLITNTPIEILKSVGSPKYKAHINIPETIESAVNLMKLGVAIQQTYNNYYVVYSGETRNLKARAREHVNGHGKTFCLGLVNYSVLNGYGWQFWYTPVFKCKNLRDADKSIRVLFEQVWRAKHGWPILCKK